jgi:choice-of-anchor B domain-containing protein
MRFIIFLLGFLIISNACEEKYSDEIISYDFDRTDELPDLIQNDKIIGKILCENNFAGIYPCKGYDLLSHIPLNYFNSLEGNDSWGWTDSLNGNEYVLMGLDDGTAFVNITDPERPIYIGKLPTVTVKSSWRDIKVFQNHAFIVSEAQGHGLQVFDLTKLRTVLIDQVFNHDAHLKDFGKAHNIAINEESGFAYVIGSELYEGGAVFIDINSPKNPLIVGGYPLSSYIHDAQIINYSGPDLNFKGKEILFGSNSLGGENNQIVIVDVTEKNNPKLISSVTYTNSGYSHQGWISEDHKYFFLGDELDELIMGNRTRTRVFDFTNLREPLIHHNYYGPTSAIDHNIYIKESLLIISNYTAGMRVVEVQDIEDKQMSEVGFFDTYPSNDSTDYYGAWNAYPFFSSGVIAISDINSGLFIVKAAN